VKPTGLKVVSLFDGIACGRLALERTGYTVSSYVAFEIDKYAKSISRYNYPDIKHLGDVMAADFSQFTDIDIVMGGSPCQKFSIAQCNEREIDKGGTGWELFMKFVEAVKVINPRYYLYENVASMHKNIRQYITEELGSEPIMINSALVSAQQRKRLYWSNIKDVIQPNDRGILLYDILENRHQSITLADKSQTILSTIYKENALSLVKRSKMGLFIAEEVGAALRTREDENGSFKRLEVRHDGKSNALTTVQTDSIICSPIRIGQYGKGGQGERIYSVKGKSVSMKSQGGGGGSLTGLYKINLPDGDYTIRKLTPIEAERCQTLPDNFTAFGIDDKGNTVKISNTQRYRTIGNGWNVDTISHILSHTKFGGDC